MVCIFYVLQIEDLSDEAFDERHKVCEVSERKRFSTFIHYPSRRSRGSMGGEEKRSTTPLPLDIRTNDLGPITPDAMSPDPGLIDTNFSISKEEAFRRRSSSASSQRFSHSFDDGHDLPDVVEIVNKDPWPERTFPLSEAEYEEMKIVLAAPVKRRKNRISKARLSLSSEFNGKIDSVTPISSRAASPAPSSSSGSFITEDPNDPEWTSSPIINDKLAPPSRSPSVILKLAKQ